MKTASRFALAVVLGVFAGCGDNWEQRECGPGTHEENGQCLPDGTGPSCGDGTVLDPNTGTCVPDPSVCGPGTVLVDGQCQDEGIVDVDAEEAPEPNDGANPGELAGTITVPAIGAPGFVIHGCVNPYQDADSNGNLDSDFDYWIVDVAAPTALHITADGVRGLAAGFVALPGDQQLFDDGWQRFGVNLAGDMSERELFLPKAGTYVLAMTDSRSLFLDAAGGPDACYYTTIEQIALPAATPGTITNTTGNDDGTLRVLSFDPGNGDLFDNLMDDGGSSALAPGIVVMKNGTYFASAVEANGIFGPTPAEVLSAGYDDTDTVDVVVDALYNYGLTPQAYTLVTTQIGAQALPTDGTDVTITPTGAPTFNTIADLNWLYFDVANDGDVVHFDANFNGDDANWLIADSNLLILANVSFPSGAPPVPGFGPGEFVRFPTAGRYYAVVFRDGATPADTWTITSTLTEQSVGTLATGTPITGAALPATGSGFYTYDPAGHDWVSLNAATTNGGTTVSTVVYDATAFGWLGAAVPALATIPFASDGSDVYEHIFRGDINTYLVRATTDAPTAGTTYDLDVEDLPFIDLGTIVAGTPFDRTGDSFAQFEYTRYFAEADAATQLAITASPNTASPTIDIIMQSLPVQYLAAPRLRFVDFITRADDGFDGDPETLSTGVTNGFVAFAVGDYFGDAGTVDLHIDGTAPQPYNITPGTLAFTSVCPDQGGSGSTVALLDDGTGFGANDEGLTSTLTLPFAFNLFGEAVTDYVLSSNGWASFAPSTILPGTGGGANGAEYLSAPLPHAGDADGMVAPYWIDGIVTELCQLETANTVTLEWRSVTYVGGNPLEFQIVLHDDSSIDYIYGPTQTATGGASIGAETTGGNFGHSIPDTITAGTSQTLTPM